MFPPINYQKKYDLPVIICISIAILFLFSKNSWLYSTNDWVDANAFMTVGNAWVHGVIPYKDIFEQKGPLLYLIYGYVAKTGLWFHGIFILETILMAISLWLLNLSFKMLSGNRFRINIMLLIYSIGFVFMPYFDRGGGVEEIGTVAIVYLLYLVTRFTQKRTIYAHHLLIASVLFTVIFWIKYTMVLTYLVLVVAYLVYLYLDKTSDTFSTLIAINTLTFGFISMIIIIYFYIHHGSNDLFNVYFIDNIFKYTGNNLGDSAHPLMTWLSYFKKILIIFAPIMAVALVKRRNKLINNTTIMLLITIAMLNFLFSNNYLYYSLIVYPIIIYLLFISNLSKRLLTIIAISLSVYVTFNSVSLRQTIMSGYQSPGQIVKKTIGRSHSVIQVGVLDSGIYNLSQQTPPAKYFQFNNISANVMPMFINEPLSAMKSKHIKYVLTKKSFYQFKKHDDFKQYTIIKSFHPYTSKSETYLILKLKGN